MQNKYFKFLIIALAVAVIVPQIALAAWWNPLTWNWYNIFNIFSKPQASTIQQNAKNTQPAAQANINYSVVLKENTSDKTKTDVYLKNSKTGQENFYATISDVYSDNYHPAEYHNGNLYIIIRTGGNLGYENNPNWTDELWKYNAQKQGIKLFSNQGLDFRVSDDEKFIVIIGNVGSTANQDLTFTNDSGNVLKAFSISQLGLEGGVSPIKWSGSYFWGSNYAEAGAIQNIVKIDAINFQIENFDVSNLNIINGSEFDLNSTKEKIVFSNFPHFYDVDSAKAYEQSGAKVDLTVYDLNTKSQQIIATSVAKAFEPKWIDENTLEYNNPNGEGRLTKQIQAEQVQKQANQVKPLQGLISTSHYSIDEYGIGFDYLSGFDIKLLGTNEEQKISFAEYDGSGDSYESAIISYTNPYTEVARVNIMRSYNGELSAENYTNDPMLYESGMCDPLWPLFKKYNVSTENIDGIKMLKVDGSYGGYSITCYYFKNLSNKLVTIALSNYKFEDVFSNISLSAEKPADKDEIAKKYNEKYPANTYWAQLTKKDNNENEPETLSQAVATPNKAFEIDFDYDFPTKSDATLTVTLDAVPVTTIKSKDYFWADTPDKFKVIVSDPSWFGKKNAVLGFNLYGPDGAQVELTNINMWAYSGLQ